MNTVIRRGKSERRGAKIISFAGFCDTHQLMLNDALKEEIQTAYSRLLDEKGYNPRHCQKAMIAEIARAIGAGTTPDDEDAEPGRICVVEAGTGTGKTIAYALAAIPIAKQQKKKIVIATATVALQEQIIYQDLPDIRHHSGLDFSFALAKGRRRYLCLARLDNALQGSAAGDRNQTMALFDAELAGGSGGLDADGSQLYDRMLTSLGRGQWDGDRDSWPEEIDPILWSRVSTDHAQCTGRQCSHFENCYFYRAREDIHRVDCIVTNQDLVLADLMMGGGAVLPAPEDTIYIFDEGHHLPEKAGNHFSHVLSIYATRGWLQQIPASLAMASAEVSTLDDSLAARLEQPVSECCARLDEIAGVLQGLQAEADTHDEGWRYRFPRGEVSSDIASVAMMLEQDFGRLLGFTEAVMPGLDQALEDAAPADREVIEHWLSVIGAIVNRLSAGVALWSNFAKTTLNPPFARWVKFASMGQVEGMEIQLASHPVSVADVLQESLWSRCAGAVITSATISVGRDFSRFQERSGIGAEHVFASLASPFRFQEQAVLQVPHMDTDPGDADAHTGELAELIPELLRDESAALVLFTSWRQMLRVADEIDSEFRDRVLMQGDLSKMELLNQHRARIDQGEPSCIFGLASFAEGVDLPGDYCRHVVIAKIPFSVPDDPVDATRSEWIEERGGNAFYELMLPNAALRVVQAAGRLLRTETDTGTVTILDRRVVSKRYGKTILGALPPFRREIAP